MKLVLKKQITFVLLILITNSCKKDKDDGLTSETQTGANTFSCKINGEVFMPKQAFLSGGTPLFGQIDTFNGSNTLMIFANNEDALITNMHFYIHNFNGVGAYNISKTNAIYVDCYLNKSSPNLEKSESGFIRIPKYQSKILSGTFEFNVKNGSENIAVSSGRFDITLR